MISPALPILLFVAISAAISIAILITAHAIGPKSRSTSVKSMPYESGMDPVHDARRRFNIGFYLLAIEFLVFDVELLILFPWAVSAGGPHTGSLGHGVFWVVMAFITILTLGFVYTWRKGVFQWK